MSKGASVDIRTLTGHFFGAMLTNNWRKHDKPRRAKSIRICVDATARKFIEEVEEEASDSRLMTGKIYENAVLFLGEEFVRFSEENESGNVNTYYDWSRSRISQDVQCQRMIFP